jgi:putative peptide zinc metalloprotease protein
VPPGPPDEPGPYDVDGHFERRMWAFASILLVFALVSVGLNVRPGPAWAEMPAERVLLTVEQGRASTDETALRAGERRYVAAGSEIKVPDAGRALLTFPGGATVILCGGSAIELTGAEVASGREATPSARLALGGGRVLAGTTSRSGAFRPLGLTVSRTQGDVTSAGPAWFAVDPLTVTVSSGEVGVGGAPAQATGADLSCGDGKVVTPPSAGPSDDPIEEGTFPAEPSGSVPPSAFATESPTPAVTETTDPSETETSRTPDPDPTTTRSRPPVVPTITVPTSRPAPSRSVTTSPSPDPTTASPTPDDDPTSDDPTTPTENPTTPTENPSTDTSGG